MRLRDFLFGRAGIEDVQHGPVPAGNAGFGAPLHIAYQEIQPPTGDAGNKGVLQTYIVPRYSAIGTGIPNGRQMKSWPSSPILYVKQTLLPTTAANPGIVSGGIYTQGLLDARNQPPGPALAIGSNPRIGSFALPQKGIG